MYAAGLNAQKAIYTHTGVRSVYDVIACKQKQPDLAHVYAAGLSAQNAIHTHTHTHTQVYVLSMDTWRHTHFLNMAHVYAACFEHLSHRRHTLKRSQLLVPYVCRYAHLTYGPNMAHAQAAGLKAHRTQDKRVHLNTITYTHAHTHTCTHKHTRTCTHTHTHAHTQTHTHTHTFLPSVLLQPN